MIVQLFYYHYFKYFFISQITYRITSKCFFKIYLPPHLNTSLHIPVPKYV